MSDDLRRIFIQKKALKGDLTKGKNVAEKCNNLVPFYALPYHFRCIKYKKLSVALRYLVTFATETKTVIRTMLELGWLISSFQLTAIKFEDWFPWVHIPGWCRKDNNADSWIPDAGCIAKMFLDERDQFDRKRFIQLVPNWKISQGP